MARLRSERDWECVGNLLDPEDVTTPIIAIAIVLSVVVFFFGSLIYDDHVSDYNGPANARAELSASLNRLSIPQRKEVASALLRLDAAKLSSTIDNVGDTDARKTEVKKRLQETSKTGAKLELDSGERRSWARFWKVLIPRGIRVVISLVMAAFCLAYVLPALGDHVYLMDLPWRRWWPYAYVLVTLWPLGWLFYPVSGIRTYAARRRERLHPDTGNDADEVANAEVPPDPTSVSRPHFDNDLSGARKLYGELRSGLWLNNVGRKTKNLEDTQEEIDVRLRELGEAANRLQRRRGEVAAELRRLSAINQTVELLPSIQPDIEFDQLMQFPGVVAARIDGDRVSLLVEASIVYKGKTYDLGDWELRFGDSDWLYSCRLRSGVLPSWGTGYPDYSYSSGEFCFGDSKDAISENLAKGQFLQAMELAINALCSVNERDEHNIPIAFYERRPYDE